MREGRKRLLQRINDWITHKSLAVKIRYSYLMLLVPLLMLLSISVFLLWRGNSRYEEMINSAAIASDFSLDFKKDYDYGTYLLIVGNKSVEESELGDMLRDANHVVSELEAQSLSREDNEYLRSAKKYLESLAVYKERIEQNLLEDDKYEDNIRIWENDVQIVTGLLRESILQYIYFEIRDLQAARVEYQRVNMIMIQTMFLVAFLLMGLMALISYYLPLTITRPIRELCEVTDQVAKGDLAVRADIPSGEEVQVLSRSLNSMIDKINELLSQVTTEQIRLRNAELELLTSQINPHFLYNTLDTIVWLAEAGEQQQVVSMVGSLSKFFRTSLNQGRDVVKLREELIHVRSYLEIQQVRYQDILEYSIDVPEELGDCPIPKITIQPLVENALYHGIKNKRGMGKISITGERTRDGIEICVSDNGIGIGEERLAQIRRRISKRNPDEDEIYGLYNVNERIRLKFGGNYGVRIISENGKGTVVFLHLPYVVEESENQTVIAIES